MADHGLTAHAQPQPAPSRRLMSLPNALTYGRILAIPALVACFFVTGDWGRSYVASQSTLEMFQQRMPTTVFIVFWAIVLGLLIAVPLMTA